jgi:hypothetical protein
MVGTAKQVRSIAKIFGACCKNHKEMRGAQLRQLSGQWDDFFLWINRPVTKSTISSLDLADDFAGATQALDHLLAFLPSAGRVIALLKEFVEFVGTVHVLQEFALHLILGESSENLLV